MLTLTVVIPTCDRPHLLERALASVARQTLQPDEVVVVDDGGAKAVAPGCRVLSTGGGRGGGAARNLGAVSASAGWLAFLDDDDEWDPGYLASCGRLMTDQDLVLTGFEKVRWNGQRLPEKVPPERLRPQEWLVKNRGLRGSNLLVRRSLLLSLGGFNEVLTSAQDMDLAVRMAEHGPRYARNPQRQVIFHAHAGPRVSTPGPKNLYGMRTFLALHGPRMTSDQLRRFRHRTDTLFGGDPGPVPRLVWVFGAPDQAQAWAQRVALPGAQVWSVRSFSNVQALRQAGGRGLAVCLEMEPTELGGIQDDEHLVLVGHGSTRSYQASLEAG